MTASVDYKLAACLGATDVMFPTGKRARNAVSYDELHAPAKAICAQCPIRPGCKRDHANERYGVWGGTTPVDRGFIWAGRKQGDGPAGTQTNEQVAA